MAPRFRRWRARAAAGLVLVLVVALTAACGSSGDSTALRTRALSLANSGQCSQALPLLARVISSQRTDVDALVAEGLCETQDGQYGAALTNLRAAVRLSADANDLQDLAQAQWAEGLQAQALQSLQHASRVAVNAQQLVSIARAMRSYGDFIAASNTLDQVPTEQRNYSWYDTAGNVETSLQDYTQASRDFTQGISVAPAADRWSIEQDFGDSYWGQGAYSQALTEYSAALQGGAEDPFYVNDQIGLCNDRLGRPQAAQSAFQSAITEGPPPALLGTIGDNLVQVDLELNDAQGARSTEQKLLRDKNVPASAKQEAKSLLAGAGGV